jgi:DNA-binding SARP family transcriptional activator
VQDGPFAARGQHSPVAESATPDSAWTPDSNRKTSRPIARIHLLGAMRATSYLGDDILPRGRKARAILGCLCLAAGQRLARNRLSTMLWDRVPDFQARASFRQAYRELVVAFGPLAKELISADRETIMLNTSVCWIDAVAVLSTEMAPQAHRAELAAHCTGELLEELDGITIAFDHWLLGERTRFVERRRALLEAELSHARGANTEAHERAEVARRLIMFDQTHEGASRILMRALADMGERAQAMREYVRCREALKMTLDVEPSSETHALYEAIRMFSGREERESAVAAAPAAPKQKKQKAAAPAPNRSRLRVGVLPFLASASHRDESLALSLSQEIAAALARFRWFDVIAPIALKRRDNTASLSDDVLRPNELDFVLDGALTSHGERYQISVRLLDLTRYATPVWSDRFELGVDELHRVDEIVTAKIVGRIDPVILFIEAQPKRREKAGAHSLLLRAIPLIYSMERKKFEEAGELIDRAMEIEPDDPMVLTWAAYWQLWQVGQRWTADSAKTLMIAQDLCMRAMRLDPENAEAAGIYAHCCSWTRDFTTAIEYFDRSLRLNPNLAYIWALSAPTYCYIGKPNEALRRLERYRELAPFDPYAHFFENAQAMAHLFNREYEQAALVGRRVVKANPDFLNSYKPLIAALGYLGETAEAKGYIETVLALEPTFCIQEFRATYPFKRDIDREHYVEGLRLAGVPEQPRGA